MSLIRSPQFSIIISSFWLFLGQFRAPCSLSDGHFGSLVKKRQSKLCFL